MALVEEHMIWEKVKGLGRGEGGGGWVTGKVLVSDNYPTPFALAVHVTVVITSPKG